MNSADPLAQLRDIHLPDPVSGWPPGPGWWLLAILVLVALALLGAWLWKRRRDNAWRREASGTLAEAYRTWENEGDSGAFLQQVNAVLKRVALRQFPNYEVARLSGVAWEAFLDRQWRHQPEQGFSALGFAEQAYRPEPQQLDMGVLHALGQRWLRQLETQPC